jgi:threonine dehydrogenase-like Zn-dependent dehydrogenase
VTSGTVPICRLGTDIVTERGDEGVEHIKELTNGIGADAVLECVGTQESMRHAGRSTRPGGYMGFAGVPHGVESAASGCSTLIFTSTAAPPRCDASCPS